MANHTALMRVVHSGAGKATCLAALGWGPLRWNKSESWAPGTPGTALPQSLQLAQVITWATMGTSTLSNVRATSRRAVWLHEFHQVRPGERGTDHPGRKTELGAAQTKQ